MEMLKLSKCKATFQYIHGFSSRQSMSDLRKKSWIDNDSVDRL